MLPFYLTLVDTKDRFQFEDIYNDYKKLMKYIACDILSDETLAEDAVQEAFLKIIPHLEKINDFPSHKLKAYIVNVIRSVCFDMCHRHDERNAINIADCEELPEASGVSPENPELLEIVDKIKELPELSRDILLYRYLYDYTSKELAEFYKISNGALRKRLQRAKEQLARLIDYDYKANGKNKDKESD